MDQLLENHQDIAGEIHQKIKPFPYFKDYLKHAYYPFYKEEFDLYEQRLEEVINMMLEIELPQLRGVDIGLVPKIKQLLARTEHIGAGESIFCPPSLMYYALSGLNGPCIIPYSLGCHPDTYRG